ncbi:hypothetical protein FSP39_023011 [Pinctada imbricata]|uniref:Anion exchange protein n=1 Tax=Pinctada imbricata TaxID=66713 RepID=A0AA88YFT3_PINIB|nr:hypothetical protein FSP39_023011 [Pinctada imbricata]
MDTKRGQPNPPIDSNPNQPPLRDLGSFVNAHVPSDADIKDHRSQDTVFIGLRLPKQGGRHRRKRHHKTRHRTNGDRAPGSSPDTFREDVAPPSQRVQDLLGEEEDDEHRAHDLFCEMEELFYGPCGEMEWKESARWIKFEEDVEEGGERWSKPHVATLSLHSLFELRCHIMTGTVMLDIEPYDLDSVVDLLLDNMVAGKQLEENLKEQVRDVLLIRHRHLNQKRHNENGGSKYHLPIIRSLADIGKKHSEPKSMHLHGEDKEHRHGFPGAKSTPNFAATHHMRRDPSNHKLEHHATHAGTLTGNSSSGDLLDKDASHKNLHFMKKIPPGAEAANILVGEVDFLTHPIVGYVRLLKSVFMPDLTEVPVPSKFIFIMLGPIGKLSSYHEIGRSIATLMSDEVFHDVAYHAKNREDILAGIDEFLDQVTVLPPGEWDPSIRIEPPKSIPSQESRKTAPCNTPMPNGKALGDTEEEDSHADPGLVRTGKLFGGLINDIRRKAPFYLSDFKDAFHIQSLASFFFLYFACLTPIITFGGLLGDATDKNLAAIESLLAGAICGVVYALFSGQPLTILGSTGPILVYETILYDFCFRNDWDYLELRLWIGVWTGAILIVMVALDCSAWVRYITRFTEESFALLISLIFIKEAFAKLFKVASTHPIHFFPEVFYPHHICDHLVQCLPPNITESVMNSSMVNGTNITAGLIVTTVAPNLTTEAPILWSNLSQEACLDFGGTIGIPECPETTRPEVFFLSVILFFGTFTLAMFLKLFRNTRFFPNIVRRVVSDFAVLIAILTMVGFDLSLGIRTPKLEVPSRFMPTNSKERGWVVPPIGKNPIWLIFAAVIPALLLTILVFMDQQITAVIVNRKENKLKKGHGYHLDLLIIAVLVILNSFMGLPWFVAATVLSITHVVSLQKESECTAPGERPKFLGVREQRATGVAIFLMIGISTVMTNVLRAIPMPVLYGVFLYMGISSLRGMQIVQRILIWFSPAKYQPDYMYLRHVKTNRVHLFTAIQVFCLVLLWVIKSIKETSIAFPIMVLAMCFIRKGMDKIFTQTELKWLDDVMPESHKRKKEEDGKGEEEIEMTGPDGSNSVMVPLDGGNVLNIPVNMTTSATDQSFNISEEMAKTSLWKNMMNNDMNNKSNSPTKPRKRNKGNHRDYSPSDALPTIPSSPTEMDQKDKKKGKKPFFYIDEEEKEQLLHKPPQIVVDPPSYDSAIGD